jgi:hypothetical protein
MDERQKKALVEINEKLSEIKTLINENWKDDENNPEVVLFIEDKKTNPYRKQTEDIEGDINDMQMLGR